MPRLIVRVVERIKLDATFCPARQIISFILDIINGHFGKLSKATGESPPDFQLLPSWPLLAEPVCGHDLQQLLF